MSNLVKKWLIFSALCLIWGSSFILIKLGMFDNGLQPVWTAWQVGALRIFSAGLVLLPFGIRALKKVPRKFLATIFLSGLLGNFFPAFLFCLAETRIGSALTGMLNALTPIFAILIGTIIYKLLIPRHQIIGVVFGFLGCAWLFLAKAGNGGQDIRYAAFVVLATFFYALNVNLVRSKLQNVGSIEIAAIAFILLLPLSGIILFFTGFFSAPIFNPPYLEATIATCILGIVGTAFASIIFYKLVKLAGPVFSSMVTYGIPFVAMAWGFWYNESITPQEVAALLVILSGVYLASFGFPRLFKMSKTPGSA